MEIRVTGAAEIAAIADACRRVGPSRVIVNTMAREIKQGVKPIRESVKAHELAVLPAGGGLNKWVSGARIVGVVRRSAKSAGVTIRQGRNSQTGKRSDLRRLDAGRIRHMSWGRPPWHPQTVVPNAFTEGVTEEGLDQLERATLEAAERAAEAITRG